MANRAFNEFIQSGEVPIVNLNGFDRQDPTSIGEIDFYPPERMFSISTQYDDETDIETPFSFWCKGKKFTIEEGYKVVTIPDVTGLYYCYFDNDGELQYANATDPIPEEVFTEYALVGLVYWNSENQSYIVSDERHGITMDGITHNYLPQTRGAVYAEGAEPIGFTAGTSTYTSISEGKGYDEDILYTFNETTDIPFLYKSGGPLEWTVTDPDNSYGFTDGGTSCKWNKLDETSGTWSLAEADADTDVQITFFVALPEVSHEGYYKIIGQSAYPNKGSAREAIKTEIEKLETYGLPSLEIVFLYAVIYKKNGNLVTQDDGALYYDLRGYRAKTSGPTIVSAANVPTNPTNFGNRLNPTDTDVQKALETISQAPTTLFTVTSAYETEEVIDLTNGNGANGGTSALWGNPISYIGSNEYEFAANRIQIFVNGTLLMKGQTIKWVSSTSVKFLIPLEPGDQFVVLQ
jgi:hypothetical protein